MAKMDIAIDMGTSYTSILVSGNGIVLHEPSVIGRTILVLSGALPIMR